jgi:predicted transposase/invertase (TIGR01784 family)
MIEIDPTNDFVCKMLLGNPAHSRLTIHFLNAVLRPVSPIVEVEYLNPFVMQEFELDKLAVLDILARDDQGRRLNIEVQRTNPGGLPERLVYYASSQLVEQIQEGEGYHLLRPSIGICLLKAKLFPNLTAYHQQFRLRTHGGLELTNCLEIHTLELPKFTKACDNQELLEPLEEWMDFFCNAKGSTPDALRKRLNSPVFSEAIGVLEMISKTPDQRRYYDARMKWERDEATRVAMIEKSKAEMEKAKVETEKAMAETERAMAETEKAVLEGKAAQIHLLQGLLDEPATSAEVLHYMSLSALDELIVGLQRKVRDRLK